MGLACAYMSNEDGCRQISWPSYRSTLSLLRLSSKKKRLTVIYHRCTYFCIFKLHLNTLDLYHVAVLVVLNVEMLDFYSCGHYSCICCFCSSFFLFSLLFVLPTLTLIFTYVLYVFCIRTSRKKVYRIPISMILWLDQNYVFSNTRWHTDSFSIVVGFR